MADWAAKARVVKQALLWLLVFRTIGRCYPDSGAVRSPRLAVAGELGPPVGDHEQRLASLAFRPEHHHAVAVGGDVEEHLPADDLARGARRRSRSGTRRSRTPACRRRSSARSSRRCATRGAPARCRSRSRDGPTGRTRRRGPSGRRGSGRPETRRHTARGPARKSAGSPARTRDPPPRDPTRTPSGPARPWRGAGRRERGVARRSSPAAVGPRRPVDRGGRARRSSSPRNPGGTRSAPDAELPFRFLEPVDGGDAGVVERREQLRLAAEAGQAVGILRELGGEHREGHVPPELRVRRAIDLPHPARADRRGDPVVREALADHGVCRPTGSRVSRRNRSPTLRVMLK